VRLIVCDRSQKSALGDDSRRFVGLFESKRLPSRMLSRLWRWWFWHSGCIVGAAAHVAALHFSGNHLENM
jgi:hypothetical protein